MPKTNNSVDDAFDALERGAEALALNSDFDNEATRHIRLVVPFITHPSLLGWSVDDIFAETTVSLPGELFESLIFRDASTKSRRPDIVVAPADYDITALVVEEKKKQTNVDCLEKHKFQLLEYQSLHDSVWGILTDGEKWIIRKNFETWHTFENLAELKAGLSDTQNCIGKPHLLQRYEKYGTCDLVILNSPQTASRVLSVDQIEKLRLSLLDEAGPKLAEDQIKRQAAHKAHGRKGMYVGAVGIFPVFFYAAGPVSHEIRYEEVASSYLPIWNWPDGSQTGQSYKSRYDGPPGIARVDILAESKCKVFTMADQVIQKWDVSLLNALRVR